MWRSALTKCRAALSGRRSAVVSSVPCRTVMWPPEFEDAVRHPSDFMELKESGEYERKRLVPIKAALNDASCSVFHDPLVVRFRNTMMRKSQKQKADQIMRHTFHRIKDIQIRKRNKAPEERRALIDVNPVKILNDAVENARPLLFLNQVRVGAVVYNVPAPITEDRSIFEGIRWIMEESYERDKAESRLYEKLADVLVDTAAYTGKVIARKHEHHRLCEQNRAYAHYRKGKY